MDNRAMRYRDTTSKYVRGFDLYCNDGEFNKRKNLKVIDNFNSYNQAASEAIVYYFFRHLVSEEFVKYDVKLAYPHSEKDVDVVASNMAGYEVRVEVKTPDFVENDGELHIKIGYRSGNNEESRDFINQSASEALKRVRKSGVKASIDKLDDLKIETYLDDANLKFGKPSSNNQINIVFICSDSIKMFDFFRYYTNEKTGVISRHPYIKISSYPNVDLIVFSNCSEAHLDDNFKFNPWDLKNYLCFVLPLTSDKNSAKFQYAETLFSSKLNELAYYTRKTPERFPDSMQMVNFIMYNYPQFCLDPNKRKY